MHLLITGASGLLAREFAPLARQAGWRVDAVPRSGLDITDREAVMTAVRRTKPDGVVNLAAFTDVDRAEAEFARACAVNAEGAGHLAEAAAEVGAVMVQLSTDYVFGGEAAVPYRIDSPPDPVNCYGRSKLHGEIAVRERSPHHLIVRTSWLFGAGGPNFVDSMLVLGRRFRQRGDPLRVVDDQRGRPTWTRSLAEILVALLERDVRGTVHASNDGDASWYELARAALRLAGIQVSMEPVTGSEFPRPARRPGYSVLDLTCLEEALGRRPPHWRSALARYLGAGSGLASPPVPQGGES